MTIREWGGGGEVLRYFHLYLGSEHYFWLKFQKSNTFGSMKICGFFFIFFFWRGGGGRGSLRYRTFFEGGHFYTF